MATVLGATQTQMGCHVFGVVRMGFPKRTQSGRGKKEERVVVPSLLPPTPPIIISMNPAHVDYHQLRELYRACNHSCHQVPNVVDSHGGLVEAIDIDKLRVALSHSFVVVSVFSRWAHPEKDKDKEVNGGDTTLTKSSSLLDLKENLKGLGLLLEKMTPMTPSNSQLVGFGRAVSDHGLTACIYDVMVIPTLQGRGIGQRIVKKIIRKLTSKEIYDIAVLCSDNQRIFFEACGFGDDILGSTTMVYRYPWHPKRQSDG